MKLKLTFILIAILLIAIWFIFIRDTNSQNVQMNNATCPVSGNPANTTHTYTYKGKEYNLCSEKCKQPLSENPDKYFSE